MARNPQPWTEYLRLALLAITLVPIKGLIAFVSIFFAYISGRISFCLPWHWRDPFLEVTLKIAARGALLGCGFWSVRTIRVEGEENGHVASNTQGKRKLKRAMTKGRETRTPVAVGAVVSNHVGWADILIHMCRWLPSFVARAETARLPFIGVAATSMGCVFVDRERNGGSNGRPCSTEQIGAAAAVKQRMQEVSSGTGSHRRPILLFPEGTTTNGRYLLNFRTGAFIAGVPVQPVILRYGPSRVSPAWETIGGMLHVFLILTSIQSVEVLELPVYIPSEEEKADPRLFADNVRAVMLKHSKLIPADSKFEDKRMYHAMLQKKELPVIKKTQ